MADMSPAFNPPPGAVKDNDPMVAKVSMMETDWGFRKSQQPAFDTSESLPPIEHVPNGR